MINPLSHYSNNNIFVTGSDKKNIYSMKPKTTEEFVEYAQAIVERLTIYEVLCDSCPSFDDHLSILRMGEYGIIKVNIIYLSDIPIFRNRLTIRLFWNMSIEIVVLKVKI